VNEAIEKAYTGGILTTTCLMVGESCVEDAVSRAKRLPQLGVGLHVVVARGKPTLSPKELPTITADGFFHDNLIGAGFRYFFSKRARSELRAEIRAQFEAFQKTGLMLDHVNAHNHMHLHPTILGIILELAEEFGVKAVRLPAENSQNLGSFLLTPWIALMRRRLRRAGIRFNDQIVGISETGMLDKTTLLAAIDQLPDGVTEVFSHPATKPWESMDPKASAFKFEEEFEALVAPEVTAAINKSDISLATFRDI
tara:strand:- start:7053 stop:7814 length:762 start_codon:yes stop_codon:yes gene_type:complete